MGLFTSNCVACHEAITWFCDPRDMVCPSCGHINKADEIVRTWHEHYDLYQEIMTNHFKKTPLAQVKEIYKDSPVAQNLLNKKNLYNLAFVFLGHTFIAREKWR